MAPLETATRDKMKGGSNIPAIDRRRKKRLRALAVFLLTLFCEEAYGNNVCEAEMIRAAAESAVPLPVLYAVALTETGQRGELSPYALNVHGHAVLSSSLQDGLLAFDEARRRGEKLIDVGCMQINHFYHGEKFINVEEMFAPRRNVDYAARFLKLLHRKEGTWTAAVARYHAGPGNTQAQHRYVCAVIRNMLMSGFGAWTPESEAFCRR